MPRKRTNHNISEAERAAKNAYQREWAKKKRERLATEAARIQAMQAAPDYKALYEEECRKNNALELKVEELNKVCKAYAEREQKMATNLQKSAIEYNARTKYMLDVAKHAYMSMQFAVAAAEQGGDK